MTPHKLIFVAVALSTIALAQSDGPYQVRYAANLDCLVPEGIQGNAAGLHEGQGAQNLGGFLDSSVTFINTGANNAQDICVNTYTFSPDEQLVSCCACRVTRNAVWSLGVRRDLTSNTLTPGSFPSAVIKLLATAAPASGSCNPANPGTPVQGLAAWGTTIHLSRLTSGIPYLTEAPFTNSTLSAAEEGIMTTYCGFIQANGSGYGICNSCQTDKLGLGPDDPTYNTALGSTKQ